MASAREQKTKNRIDAIEKLAKKANQEAQICRNDLEITHVNLLIRIKDLEDKLTDLMKEIVKRP